MYIGSIDQGTTSSRFIIFNKGGEIISVGQKEHKQIYPQAGWVEHDSDEIWKNTQEVIGLALGKANLSAKDLAAVGITNQRETTVVWNKKTGKAYYNAIVWQDTRVGSELAELAKDGGMDRFRAKTGLPLATYFSGLKLRWLLNNIDGLRADAEKGDAQAGQRGGLGGNDDLAGLIGVEFLGFAGDDLEAMGPEIGWCASGGGGLERA